MINHNRANRLTWREFIDELIADELPTLSGASLFGGDIATTITARIVENNHYWDTPDAHTQFLSNHVAVAQNFWDTHPDLAAQINPFRDTPRLVAAMIHEAVAVRLNESNWILSHETQQSTLSDEVIEKIFSDLSISPQTRVSEEIKTALEAGKTVFEKNPETGAYSLHGTTLTEGDTIIATTKDGKEHSVIVGTVTECGDGTQMAEFQDAYPLDQQAHIEDGHIIFINTPDGYLIHGKDLESGTLVGVTTHTGDTKYVIVGTVTDRDDGTQMATFEFAPVFRRSRSDGAAWIVEGTNLISGQEVLVPTRDGSVSRVRIDTVTPTSKGRSRATFTPLDQPAHHHRR